MATGELRDRVRERLVSAERELARGVRRPTTSCGCWRTAPPEEVAERRARLARALADFDSATIATTHGFCQEVLGGIGVAGDMEPDAEVVEDVGDLLDEVVDDLYVRKYMDRGRSAAITRAEAMQIARERRQQPGLADRAARRLAATACRRCARGLGGRRARGARAAQARALGDHLRRPADAACATS